MIIFLNEQSISEQRDIFKWPDVCKLESLRKEELGTEKTSEEMIAEISPNLMKTIEVQ